MSSPYGKVTELIKVVRSDPKGKERYESIKTE